MKRRSVLVTYDRAGYGDSDPLPSDLRTSKPAGWSAAHLAQLLGTAGVDAPYVLVGHSLGGQIADAYATQRPEAEDERPGTGWHWDVKASAEEFETLKPRHDPPVVLVASAIWRWFSAKEPSRYRPLSLADVDQRWQRSQLRYAERWNGHLLVAHDAGHRVRWLSPTCHLKFMRDLEQTWPSADDLKDPAVAS